MLPNITFGIKERKHLVEEFERNKSFLKVADKITLLDILQDNKTITTKNNGLVQVIKLEGKDYSGLASTERGVLFQERKRFFDSLADDISVTFHYHRKRLTNLHKQTETEFDNKHIREISKRWQDNFKDAYRTEIYMVVRQAIPKKIVNKLALIKGGYRQNDDKIFYYVEQLNSQVKSICRSLISYNPKTLTHSKDDKSELIKFWSYLVNGRVMRVGESAHDIGEILSITDITFNFKERVVVLDDDENKRYCKILSVKSYPEETTARLFEYVLQVRHKFNVVQQVVPIERENNKLFVAQKIRQLQTMDTIGFMRGRLNDLEEAGEELENGSINFTNHTLSIFVYGDSAEDLERAVRDVRAALSQGGISTVSEGTGLEVAYWSMLPDYESINFGRRTKASTENIADFLTLGTSHEGLGRCSFGEKPVALFKTTANTNYAFTFHASPEVNALGHTMVIGGSGKGKTTLISFLLMNCLKYEGLKILAFDSYQGAKIPFITANGEYITVGMDNSLKLNPMMLPESFANRQFLEEWIKILAKGVEDDEEKTISEMVRQNYELDLSDRGLYAIRSIAGHAGTRADGRQNLVARLNKWLPTKDDAASSAHTYGMLFNAKKDSLSFSKRLVAFDMAKALQNSELLASLSSYIFHAFGQHIDTNPSPHIVFIDEMAQYINNPTFAPFISKGFREIRKRNGIMIGAVQEASSITESPIASSIINNLATYIIFPDATANPEDYLNSAEEATGNKRIGLGLTDSEFEWVRTSNPERQVMVKRRGGESVIIDIDMHNLGELLSLFSSNITDIKLIEKLHNQDEKSCIDEYLKTKLILEKRDKAA
jgi:type IV secretion system protein VirB4